MQTIYRFSAPGRTEISGNHTDHQHGCVLAAAVNMQTTAEVTLRDDDCIRVASEGYAPVEIRLDDLSIHEDEKNTTAAIVRGVAAAFRQRGCELRGFDASVRSTVLPGSGLSSSAAFEVLIGTILNELFFDRKLTAVEIAQDELADFVALFRYNLNFYTALTNQTDLFNQHRINNHEYNTVEHIVARCL